MQAGACRPRCDARQTAMHPRQQHMPLAEEAKAEMFTWCSLQLAQFSEVMDSPSIAQSENVLLTHKVGLFEDAAVVK